MRHRVSGNRLGRSGGHRTCMRRTMIRQLFTHERIQTTRAKAKSIRSQAEQLITLARNSSKADDIHKVNARRRAAAILGGGPDIVKKLFDDIGPRYIDRNGGYTRIFRLGLRQGDSAEMVIIELVED